MQKIPRSMAGIWRAVVLKGADTIEKKHNKKIPTRSFAILLVLMFLLLLYTLGVAFLMVTIIQWEIVEAWYDDVRAREIAETGIYSAINRLYLTFPMQVSRPEVPCIWRYWGDDLDEDELDGDEEENLVPIEYAQNPSFAWEAEDPPDPYNDDPRPRLIEVTFPWGVTKKVGFSGFSPKRMGRYGINSEIFSLKVVDTSSQLYINEGLGHPYNSAVMRRMLNILGTYLNQGYSWDVPQNLGDIIILNRPPGGYRYKQELLKFLSREAYLKVKHFICAHTWVDTKVCNPVPLSPQSRNAYLQFPEEGNIPYLYRTRPKLGSEIITRYGRNITDIDVALMFYDPFDTAGATTLRKNAMVYGYDELNPCWIEITSRAPVNINTAPKAVLIALLTYLQGFFLLEQLRATPSYVYYRDKGGKRHYKLHWIRPGFQLFKYKIRTGCRGMGARRFQCSISYPGEIGIVFKTEKINIVVASLIADMIIQRRARRPFNSWEDFNLFIDGLVEEGILYDTRCADDFILFEDTGLGAKRGESAWGFYNSRYTYDAWSSWHNFDIYKRYASQAIADTIKANANPNLHLNEINPNSPLCMLVDKTDLIRNSTEFCFIPTGVFEIESQGLVLRPRQGFDSLEADNIVKGRRKIISEIKLYDIYRECTQRDFQRGDFGDALYETNGNWTTESYPEPAQGVAPFENNYEGYITLATVGGSLESGKRLKGVLFSPTPEGHTELFGSSLHAHYDFDFLLHHTKDTLERYPLTERSPPKDEPTDIRKVTSWNVKDKTEEDKNYTSPYSTVYERGRRYRIARTYTYCNDLTVFDLSAPLDQRVDGVYLERHAVLPYYVKEIITDEEGNLIEAGNFNSDEGMISYWIKPGFWPGLLGKTRCFISMTSMDYPADVYFPLYFGHYFSWSSHKKLESEKRFRIASESGPVNLSDVCRLEFHRSLRPSSLTAILGRYVQTKVGSVHLCGSYYLSPTLNHSYHKDKRKDHLKGHNWTNIIAIWKLRDDLEEFKEATFEGDMNLYNKLFINGRDISVPDSPSTSAYHIEGRTEILTGAGFPSTTTIYPRQYSERFPDYEEYVFNPIFLGGASGRPFNFPADSTIDEFFVWPINDLDQARQTVWARGRYYIGEAIFESGIIELKKLCSAGPNFRSSSKESILLGISWGWYNRVIEDYESIGIIPDITEPEMRTAEIAVYLMDGENLINQAPLKKSWWQWIYHPIQAGLKYELRFMIKDLSGNSILLQTPIFDDILIYYRHEIEFLSWILV